MDCADCVHCLACVGIEGAEFCVLNEPYSRERYFALLKEISLEVESRVRTGWYPELVWGDQAEEGAHGHPDAQCGLQPAARATLKEPERAVPSATELEAHKFGARGSNAMGPGPAWARAVARAASQEAHPSEPAPSPIRRGWLEDESFEWLDEGSAPWAVAERRTQRHRGSLGSTERGDVDPFETDARRGGLRRGLPPARRSGLADGD
ncbi:MAG: hypothetical protein V3V08_02980 [Nannocystaceae bacterium]